MIEIPASSILRPTSNLFTATFNTPTAGKYNWGVSANTDVEILKISPGNLYVIRIVNFGATVDEGDFLENVETIPKISMSLLKAGKAVFGGPFPFVNYLKNNEVIGFFWTPFRDDQLLGTFTGQLGQNASLAGVSSITAHVSLNIFEITDQDYINKFRGIEPAAAGARVGVPPELERRI
jgi:hypothetical protein